MPTTVPSSTRHPWWLTAGMTSVEDVIAAATERGAFRTRLAGDLILGSAVPMLVVEAHGGPWLIYPDPLGVRAWIGEQVFYPGARERLAPFVMTAVDGEGQLRMGWLGAGDAPAAEIVGKLLDGTQLVAAGRGGPTLISTVHMFAPTSGEAA